MENEELNKGLSGELPVDATAVERVDPAARELPMRHPGREVGLAELAARKGEGLAIIEARAKILETLRKAAIRATSPEDWLLFKDRKGAVIGYLQDCGGDRVRDLYGIEIFDVGRPEKVAGEDGDSFMYLIEGSGRCAITKQVVEAIEGGRSSADDFVLGLQGAQLELAVRKAARANLDGNITRELAGLKSVPQSELDAAWKDSSKNSANCRLGRGFGSGAERLGANKMTGAPECPKGHGDMRFVPAGNSKKSGKDYTAFWSCDTQGCSETIQDDQVQKQKPDPATDQETANHTEAPDGDPGPQEEDQGVNKGDINF